jgi:hypothetical protein
MSNLLTKKDRASIALNNKMQLKLLTALMKKAVTDKDREKLMNSYEFKLEELETEITSANDLLKKAAEDRKKHRTEWATINSRLEKISKFNYLKEKVGDEFKYYKLRRPNPRDLLYSDTEVSGNPLNPNLVQSTTTPEIQTQRIELDAIKIPIEEEVYNSIMRERRETSLYAKDVWRKYNAATKQEVTLLDKYKKSKGKNKKSGLDDLAFKIDILKEQLAHGDIYLKMYQNYKDDFDGVVWNEEKSTYLPIRYDDYISTQPLKSIGSDSDRVTPYKINVEPDYDPATKQFNSDISAQNFKLGQSIQQYEGRTFRIPDVSWYTDRDADFTSKYIQITQPRKEVEGRNIGQVTVPGVVNYRNKPSLNPMANTQQDMQNQIKSRLARKNQNMNPVGFNMKNYLDK